MTEETLDQAVQFVKQFAAKSGSIVAITGAIDLVSDGEKCYVIRNGRPEMGKITGTGCQLSGMMTAFLVANPDNHLEAAAAAVCTMVLQVRSDGAECRKATATLLTVTVLSMQFTIWMHQL